MPLKNNLKNIRGYWRVKKILTPFIRRGIILMYHRIADLDFDPWCISVFPSYFEEHMQVIKRFGKPVQMNEMENNLKRFSFGKKEIVITFDDGYADNYRNARPILERYGIPATFFVTSGAVDSREEFWWDEIARIILTSKVLPPVFELAIGGTIYHWGIKEEEKLGPMRYIPGTYQNNTMLTKTQLNYALWEILSRFSFKEKKEILRQIALWAGQSSKPRLDYLPMNSQELMSLASSPLFEIGAHTVCHPMLSRLPVAEQEEEITLSKYYLENIINRPVTSFAYPHGDYSNDTLQLIKRLKFENACTIVKEAVARNADQFLLPRFMVFNWNINQFEQKLLEWLTEIQ
jgi:peptidoglycan/xylan/chitin deacetylase (PgdA/CDA1 family)